jgi:peptidyl-prolyl cis-trans isomerase C
VQSNFGWHVIQLDEVRELKAPNFDDVKPQIVQRMRQMAVEKHILDLRAKAKVE